MMHLNHSCEPNLGLQGQVVFLSLRDIEADEELTFDYAMPNVILTRPVKGSTLKSWGMRLAARAGMRKAKVAVARKLAVVLHRMLADDTTFLVDKAAPAAAH